MHDDSQINEEIKRQTEERLKIFYGGELKHQKPPSPKKKKALSKTSQPSFSSLNLQDNVSLTCKFYKVSNTISDNLIANMEPAEEICYWKLWRLSWGYHRNYCRIGYNIFLRSTSLKSRLKVIEGIQGLIKKGYIARVGKEDGTTDTNQQGTLYRVFSPEEINENIPNTHIREALLHQKKLRGIPDRGIPDRDQGILEGSIPDEKLHYIDLKDNLKTALSQPTHHPERELINYFYKKLGTKPSQKKFFTGCQQAKELLQEFSYNDITAAIDWVVENRKPDSFALVSYIIDQALRDKKEEVQRIVQEEELERRRRLHEEIKEEEKAKAQKVQEYIEKLSTKERETLRQEAQRIVDSDPGINKEISYNIWVTLTEKELVEQKLFGKEFE